MNRTQAVALALAAMVAVPGLGAAASAADVALPGVAQAPTEDVDRRPATDRPARLGTTGDASAATNESVATDAVSLVTTEGDLQFAPAKDQVLRGEAELPAGTDVVVVVTSREHDFVAIEPTKVAPDGTFREELDLSNLPDGATPRVVVLHEGDQVVNTTAQITQPGESASIDARWNRVYVSPDRETIHGTTSLPDGSTITVRIDSAGDTQVDRSRTVRVGDGGTFAATFDFGDLPHATHFRVSVSHDGTRLDYAVGLVLD